MKDKIKMAALGAVTGLANGFFGSGGGIIAVPLLKRAGLETKKAHACSLAVTLPLSAVSVFFYHSMGAELTKGLTLIIPGLIGAFAGTRFMKKISPRILSAVFGILLIIAGGRGLLI